MSEQLGNPSRNNGNYIKEPDAKSRTGKYNISSGKSLDRLQPVNLKTGKWATESIQTEKKRRLREA